MVSFCGFFGCFLGVAMSFFFHSVLNFMVGVARFSFSFQWGTVKLFSRDFSQAPKDRCGVASGGLGIGGRTSVIGRGAWSSFLVGNDPADLCSMETFRGTAHPGWRSVGLLTSLGYPTFLRTDV